MSADEVNLAVDAHGGMTEFYQAARARYEYSEFLVNRRETASDYDEACWCRNIIQQCQMLHEWQLSQRKYLAALLTRELLDQLLKRMRVALDNIQKRNAPVKGEML